MSALNSQARALALADPGLRDALVRFVGSRLPHAEVDDVVQETLADALVSSHAPETIEQIRGWVHGIARHKVADFYRSRRARMPADDVPEPAEEPESLDARELLRWANDQTEHDPAQRATLEWMLREGDGDQLQEIAREARVPAARVRQRVSRLRRALRSRWTAELSAAAGVIALAVLVFWWAKMRRPEPIVHEPPKPELLRGRDERERALRDCRAGDWDRCIAELDAARRLDPAGDRNPVVKRMRTLAEAKRAEKRSEPPAPVPAMSSEPAPSHSAPFRALPPKASSSSDALPPKAPSSNESFAPTAPSSSASLSNQAPSQASSKKSRVSSGKAKADPTPDPDFSDSSKK